MSRETKVPSIPNVRDDNVREVLEAIKSTLEVREGNLGNPLDQVATLRDLVALGVAEEGGETAVGGGTSILPVLPVFPPENGGYNPGTDYTTPPPPTNLRASGGFSNVFLEWDGAPYRNHGYTEIWRAYTNNLGEAVLIGTTAANVYADAAEPGRTYYYWVRFVSVANITGPYNLTNGVSATTAIDVSAAITALSNEITNSQLFIDLGSRIASSETRISNVTELTSDLASTIQTLTSTVGNNSASLQVQGTVSDGLRAQYTVKIDNNGYVTGFGLASTTVDGKARSSFIVRADAFAIAPAQAPAYQSFTAYLAGDVVSFQSSGETRVYRAKLASTGILPGNTTYWEDLSSKLPFIVYTVPTVVGGVTYPAGTYINTAFIGDATIQSAKIGSLVADKITAGSLTAAIGITTGVISGGVNTSFAFGSTNFGTGFYLGNDAGTYKFRVGSPTQNVTWNGTTLSVAGTVTATAGAIGGCILASNSISSSNYIAGSTGWRLSSTGDLEASNGTFRGALSGATGTFAGSLSAATGTFSGSLSAATGTFSGSLSAATGSFSGSLSAASGTFSGSLTASAINAVNTINIAGNAVTIPTGSQGTNAVAFWANNTTAVSATLDPGGGAVIVSASIQILACGSGLISNGNDLVYVRLYRGATLLATKTIYSYYASVPTDFNNIHDPGVDVAGEMVFHYFDASVSGSTTYSIQVSPYTDLSGNTGNNNFACFYGVRSISVIGAKR